VSTSRVVDIDRIDLEILALLQEDGRKSLVDIARAVGLTHPSVRARIKRLVDSGVAKVSALVDPRSLGLRLAFVNALVEDVIAAYSDLSKLCECPRIVMASVKGGSRNVSMLVLYRDPREVEAFVNKILSRVRGVKSLDIELDAIIKPRHLPVDVARALRGCGCDCSSCPMRLEPIECPGCCLRSLAGGSR